MGESFHLGRETLRTDHDPQATRDSYKSSQWRKKNSLPWWPYMYHQETNNSMYYTKKLRISSMFKWNIFSMSLPWFYWMQDALPSSRSHERKERLVFNLPPIICQRRMSDRARDFSLTISRCHQKMENTDLEYTAVPQHRLQCNHWQTFTHARQWHKGKGSSQLRGKRLEGEGGVTLRCDHTETHDKRPLTTTPTTPQKNLSPPQSILILLWTYKYTVINSSQTKPIDMIEPERRWRLKLMAWIHNDPLKW